MLDRISYRQLVSFFSEADGPIRDPCKGLYTSGFILQTIVSEFNLVYFYKASDLKMA